MSPSSSLYTRAIANLVFPLHERFKGHSTQAVRERLEASQWWPRERIIEAQAERLQAFVRDACGRVPYYERRFAEAGVDPQSVRDATDLARLPFLTKADVRNHREQLVARDAGPLSRLNTGGSTGEPMIFLVGRDRVSHDVAAKWRATRWWGVDIGDRELVVWGSPIELKAQDRARALRDRLFRTRLFSAFRLSAEAIDRLLADVAAHPPRMLFGYPSAIALVAERARARGQDLGALGIRVAFVTAERCYDHQREIIRDVFGCPVANGYGGRDAGFIAHECPAGGLHISAEDIVVEIIDADGRPLPDGELGEICVTHLATGEFPFLRYRTGDMGVRDPDTCPCGRGLPLLREVSGRSTDFIRMADGSLMHGLGLIYVVRDLPGIANFKIIQEQLDRIRVKLVPNAQYSPAVETELRQGLRRRLGDAFHLAVELVQDIPPEASGKYRYVVNALEQGAVKRVVEG